MGVDDYHVSVEDVEQARIPKRDKLVMKYKRIELLAYKWEAEEIDSERLAEAVFGIVNGG